MAASSTQLEPPQTNRRKPSRLFLATGALAVAVAAAFAMHRPARQTAASGRFAVQFVLGQRLIYRVDFHDEAASDFGALFANAQTGLAHVAESTVQGELIVSVLEADADHISLAYQIRPTLVQIQADGQAEPDQAQAVQKDLAWPVFGLLDGRGRIQSVRFDPATNFLTRQMVRTLLAATQFVGPQAEDTSQSEWDAEEDDPAGTLIAHYQSQADGTVHKTKPRDLVPARSKKTRTIHIDPKVESDGEYVEKLDAAHALAKISAEEGQSISYGQNVVGQAMLKFDMQLLDKVQCTADELTQLRSANAERTIAAAAVPLNATMSDEESQLAVQRQELGAATLESLLAELEAADSQPPETSDGNRLFLKFKALATVRPASCARLGQRLIHAEPGSLTMRTLADALEGAGNPAAQSALCAAIVARIDDWPALQILIPALAACESPTRQTEQLLVALAFGKYNSDIRTTARLALGTIARHLSDESPAKAAEIADRLLQGLAEADSIESKWRLLLAIGNSGSPAVLPALMKLCGDSNPQLRSTAVWATRWIDSPEVDPFLAKQAIFDPRDFRIRLEAVRALRFRDKSSANIAAEEKALSKEVEPEVRVELLGNLWDVRDIDSQAQRVVRQAAADDPSPNVRAAAAKLVESASPSQAAVVNQ